ncbi:MAG: SDR family NAD(P)-dependent oxidoreductase [Myxococcales bacterium]|nr:SDR family NAD(P)-dependent oxidoreductase [Myxococcales bacterium]
MSGSLAGRSVALTGATGFLGRYIARVLLARGAHVIGVVRDPQRVPALVAAGVEMRRADLAEPAALRAAFEGAEIVISNAALFSLDNQSWRDHLQTNVAGTENVMHAARDARVERVLHVSSVAVYRGHHGGLVAEDHPQHSERSQRRRSTVYAISKAVSEQRAWHIAARSALRLTTVRPSMIFGAFDPNFTPWLRRIARLPIVPAMARLGFVYGGDVAEGIALALERDDVSVGRAFNLSGDNATSWQVLRAFAHAEGRRWLRAPLPLPVSRLFDNTRAKTVLGWRPRALDEAARETLALEQMLS